MGIESALTGGIYTSIGRLCTVAPDSTRSSTSRHQLCTNTASEAKSVTSDPMHKPGCSEQAAGTASHRILFTLMHLSRGKMIACDKRRFPRRQCLLWPTESFHAPYGSLTRGRPHRRYQGSRWRPKSMRRAGSQVQGRDDAAGNGSS